MAREMGAPFLGSIPIDPSIAAACAAGTAGHGPGVFEGVAAGVLAFVAGLERHEPLDELYVDEAEEARLREERHMRIAIPIAEGELAQHFGHCASFALIDVDESGEIFGRRDLRAPEHEPGVLPAWLAERGANMVLAGGMGSRAQGLFAEKGIRVVVGVRSDCPEALVREYLAGTLASGTNVCDH